MSLLRATLLALLLLPGLAAAQAPSNRTLREAERQAQDRQRAAETAAERLREAAEEEVRLADRRVEAARLAQAAEAEVLEARDRVEAARRQGAAAASAVAARAAALRPLLPAMLRLSMYPAETVLAAPVPPEEALRGALVLRALARRLEQEAGALRSAQLAAALAEAEASHEAAALRIAEQLARRAEAAVEAELAEARRRRGDAEANEEQAAQRAADAASRAGDVAEMLQRLERERQRRTTEERANAALRAAEAARRAAEEARERRIVEEARALRAADEARERRMTEPARPGPAAGPGTGPGPGPGPGPQVAAVPPPVASGGRALPVAGRITTQWGEAAAGGPHRGQTYTAAGGARVVSPCAGRAAYAAQFRSFGLLLIVDCGGGYHFVLGGLERLDASAGQRLLAGEPVGLLGGAGAGGGALYVELRRNGQPVDPRPWFAARS